MRYSPTPRIEATRTPAADPGELFERVQTDTTGPERRGGILLASGREPTDWAVRLAQCGARFDRAPSRWSHAGLIVEWSGRRNPESATGLEVSLGPMAGQRHLPETNGVTAFALADYLAGDRFLDFAFIAVVGGGAEMRRARDRIVAAALEPNAARDRYPLYEWIGPWLHHVYAPSTGPNPLDAGVPHPGAAFCEMAYEAAGLDLVPGALGANVCPETLWSTVNYWYRSVPEEVGRVAVWTTARPDELHFDRIPTNATVEGALERRREAT